jgi:CBS domain-containing protein
VRPAFHSAEERFPDRALREILATRPPTQRLHAVAPDDPLSRAMLLMAEHDIGLVVVLDGERLVGVLSERDLVRHGAYDDTPEWRSHRTSELMSRDVATVSPDELVGRCMALMDARRVRHLPVVEDGRVVAVVSVRDLLREAVAHHRLVLAEVERERLAAFQSTC